MSDILSRREIPVALKHPDRLYINGEWVLPVDGGSFEVVDSATEQVFYRVAEAGPVDMDAAIAAARYAFDRTDWSFLQPRERAEYLRRLGDGLRARSEEMATFWTRQAGPVFSMTSSAIKRAPMTLDFYADLADTYPWITPGKTMMSAYGAVVSEPIGVVGAIVPWNTPMSLALWKLAPALLTGCTVVLKLPPEAPGELLVLAEVADEIGIPRGVLNVVTANREVSEQLVRDPRVDKIGFTGSSAVGKRIAALCSDRLARYTLELGGKSAALILDDYDLEAAAAVIASQEITLTGQNCSSLTRIIVPKHRHDDAAEAIGAAFAAVRVGDPFDPRSQMGPLAMARQHERVLDYVRKGVSDGARLVTGGRRPAHLHQGYYVEPTVFAGVDNQSTLAQEEIFGPVVSIIAADDEAHAIDLANGTLFGLNSAVFTHDVERAWRVSRRLRAGTVGHNGFKVESLLLGFGGVKQSGFGREGGVQGVHPYIETKTVLLDGTPLELQ